MAIGLVDAYEGRDIVVDSEYVCYPVVKMLQTAREMFEKGYTSLQVKEKLEKEGSLFAVLIPENLTTLKNGGRISPAAAALAGLLKIQPLLKVEHGAIDLVDKVRGMDIVIVTTANTDEESRELLAQLGMPFQK